MSGRRVGILTFHRCINYGSFWQAKCLAEGLRDRGFDAHILDHRSSRIEFAELRCALQPTLPTPVPPRDRPLYRHKIERFQHAFESLPLSRPFCLDDPPSTGGYDAIVVGSDEVWNLHHPWYGGKAIFWGDGLCPRKLVAHAASFGHYSMESGLGAEWGDRLGRFDHISVRDSNASWMVESALGRRPKTALDPCVQFPQHIPTVTRAGEPYVAVYGHNFTQGFTRRIREWSQSRGLPLVSIGYRNDWADVQRLTDGPHEFAGFMAGAAAVATNFFHGCVFALLNHKPFACEVTPYRSVKVRCLMEAVGSDRRIVGDETEQATVDQCLSCPPETAVFEKIAEMRRSSDDFLLRALAD